MPKPSDGRSVKVMSIPDCDIHKYVLKQGGALAVYDGRTHGGPWVYMCEACFLQHGVGLGIGFGQKLILNTDPSSPDWPMDND